MKTFLFKITFEDIDNSTFSAVFDAISFEEALSTARTKYPGYDIIIVEKI